MKRFPALILTLIIPFALTAQQAKKPVKKYQGLLWEITGNGLAKPSYLFGTMHVSSKLAFHLADSFFYAIKNADVVALETNPITWQDDYSKPNVYRQMSDYSAPGFSNFFSSYYGDYFKENTFAFREYDDIIKRALSTEPSMINGMLYRTYSYRADYEEDTYLDMYIFQTGSKLGKRMTGVENFDESEKLVAEAYKDAARDRSKKGYNYDEEEEEVEEPELTDEEKKDKKPYTLEDAYRKGDLDYIDSIDNKYNRYQSKVFLEKFLYKRNEIQANSIDTILRKKLSLFVGVGCAHLPGDRGIIEMLRKMGYKLRPVQMGDRDSRQKDEIDRLRVPVTFNTVFSDDSCFSVSIPGKRFYNFSTPRSFVTQQFADMQNGAYYLITRIKTNALFLGDSEKRTLRKIDSLLYENIPGKILSKKAITRSGYNGYEITNRTRRGDVQRYNILVTPFEIVIFKISGIGDYILKGTEATQFLNSISFLKPRANGWVNYHHPQHGFSVKMPYNPMMQKDYVTDRMEFWSHDAANQVNYGILKTNIINFNFIEEDSFDLRMMDMSMLSSKNITRQLNSRQTNWNKYPALEASYRCKDSSTARVRFLQQGPVYYAQIAQYRSPNNGIDEFFNSFRIQPIQYPAARSIDDTLLKITLRSPSYPDIKSAKDEISDLMEYYYNEDDGINPEDKGAFQRRVLGNDTTGEKVFITYSRSPKNTYFDPEDTIQASGKAVMEFLTGGEGEMRLIKQDSGYVGDSVRYYEFQAVDTNSIKTIYARFLRKKEHYFQLIALGDTLSPKNQLIKDVFESLKPVDTLRFYKRDTVNIQKKFFADFASGDSTLRARALARQSEIRFDSTNFPQLKNIIDTLSWKSKNYLQLKKSFINELSSRRMGKAPVVPYLMQLYQTVKDTSDLQNEILNTLLQMRTQESFTAFKNLIVTEPPAMPGENNYRNGGDYSLDMEGLRSIVAIKKYISRASSRYDYSSGKSYGTWPHCVDTPQLTRALLPEILQLINLDDYKDHVKGLLEMMVDSSQINAADYESLFTKFYVEAKQELKKQVAFEKQEDIEKAEKENNDEKDSPYRYNMGYNSENEDGNRELEQYATLLIPFWDKNPGVRTFFNDLLKLQSHDIREKALILLMKYKHPFPDTTLLAMAADDKKRIGLYESMKQNKLEKSFPSAYSTQEMLVRSVATVKFRGDEKYDTVAFLDKLPVQLKNDTGVVYFYKYKTRKEDKKWRIASIGLQPTDSTKYDGDNDEFSSEYSNYRYPYQTDNDDWKLDESKPVKAQLQSMLNKMLFRKRKAAENFYESSGGSNYEEYLESMIPRR